MNGLKWGSSQIEEMCFGICKLTIDAIIVSDLDQDDVIDQIERIEDDVQNVDVVARNKN